MANTSNKNQDKDEKLHTLEDERMCKELSGMRSTSYGKKIAQLYKKGEIEEKVFREVYETAKDPNKMKSDSYKRFMKALAAGKFPNRAKNALQFLNSLNGTEKEKKYANNFVLKLSEDSAGPLSPRIEKNHLKELAKLREEDIKEKALKETGAAATTVIESANTSKKVEELTRNTDKNWSMERIPEELEKELKRVDSPEFLRNLTKLAKEATKQHSKGKEPAKLDAEIDKLYAQRRKAEEEHMAYALRTLSQFRALTEFSKRAGLDLNTVSRITMWFLDSKDQAAPSLKAIVVDPETGRATKKEEFIQINKIYFQRLESASENGPKKEVEAAGDLMVEFTYLREKRPLTIQTSLANFTKLVNTFEGYEEINSPEEFSKKYGFELGYKEIQDLVGAKFSAKDESFIIQSVEQRNGEWVVKLDKIVTKTKKEILPESVDSRLYFDRKQQVFELGEFGVFLRKDGYQREISEKELQDYVDNLMGAKQKEAGSLMEGATVEEKKRYEEMGGAPKGKIAIPGPGKEIDVIYLDEWKRRKEAKLKTITDENGKEVFELEYPAAFETAVGVRLPNGRKPQITKRRLDKRNLIEALNKGEIQNVGMQAPAVAEEDEGADATLGEPAVMGPVGEQKVGESPIYKAKEFQAPTELEEALPFKDVYKVGNMETMERGVFRAFWAQTRFFSVDDLWEMAKAMYEYYVRRFQRRQKERYAEMTEGLPFFAPEMRRIKQSSENEQVQQFKESFEQKGIYEVQERLQQTHNKDEMKAAYMTLSEKGQLRWDDIDMWKNLNRLVNPSLAIPVPRNGDPFTRVSDKDERTGFAFLKDAIDSLWGEGTYNDWFYKNKTTFQQNAKGYYEKGKELEGVEAGHKRRLQELLRDHKEGRYVDPHEYEGLLLHSIDAGKARMPTKVYYMIEGVAAVNGEGRTILPFDRIAHINSEMLNQFPILEHLCAEAGRPGGGAYRFTLDDYKEWAAGFDRDDPMNFVPNKHVADFVWHYLIPSDHTQNRINKALRNAEKLDHDDMFAYLPPATEEVLTNACGNTTGDKKMLTTEGYANAFPGFSEYFKSLSQYGNKRKLVEAVKSWVRFEGIMSYRFEKEKGNRLQRMDDATLNSATIVSATHPKQYMDQLNAVVDDIVERYNNEELRECVKTLRTETGDISQKDEKNMQNKVNFAFMQFGRILDRVVVGDGGEKMMQAVMSAPLEGMPFVPEEMLAQIKAEREKGAAPISSEG